jgi:3-hydroxyacyl-CoA dehydrogenase
MSALANQLDGLTTVLRISRIPSACPDTPHETAHARPHLLERIVLAGAEPKRSVHDRERPLGVRLSFAPTMKSALSEADLVQENGPERPDFKIKLFADMDDATPPDSLIASSSSGITMSVMQSGCKRPERCVIGHPFNPPHIIPLVEVVGGAKTSPAAIQQAMAFYAAIGKKPILLHKELPGHVGNRLQAALYREVMHLIQQGVLSVADADDAVSWGPGLRWGVMDPSLQWHLGGGPGGIAHFMEHLMDPLAGMIKTLGNPEITPDLKRTIVEGVLQEAGRRSVEQLAHEEDELLVGLLRLRSQPRAS